MPSRKPTAQKVLTGTFRPDRAKNEPRPASTSSVPRCPSSLGRHGKRLWRKLAPRLHRSDLLTEVDELSLELLCVAYDNYKRALELLDPRDEIFALEDPDLASGLLSRGSKGQLRRHPAVDVALSWFSAVRSLLVEFGMTPASRGRIGLPHKEPEEDPLSELLERRGGGGPPPLRAAGGKDDNDD